jgi:DNA-binding response OmpR family regulator
VKEPLAWDHYPIVVPAPLSPRADVLVVDADPGVRDVCASMLHHLGCRALARATADDLAQSLCRSVDVVLVDVESGFERADEWVRTVKRMRPKLRVLVMSGRPSRDLGMFLAEGADGVLYKPFRLAELDAHVPGER